MKLSLYFARRFLSSFIRVALVVAALLFLGDLLENISRYGTDPQALGRAFQMAGLNIASMVSEALALIVMLASIAFSVSMARSNEFIVARAVGQSALRSLLPVAVCTIAIGVISVVAFDPIANTLKEQRDRMKSGQSTQTVTIADTGFWLRQKSDIGHMIVQADAASDNGKVLRNLTLLQFDAEGIAQNRYFSPLAFLNSDELVLTEAKRWRINDDNPQATAGTLSVRRFATSITPDQILAGFPQPETIAIWSLPRFAREFEEAGFSALKYRAQFQVSLARPLMLLAMLIIGAVFTLKNARMGNLGLAMFYALAFGFGLYFLQNFSNTLGEAGQVPVIISAWFPSLAACLVALAFLLHFEDG